MTVGEAIKKLEQYEKNMILYDADFYEIEDIDEKLWVDTNYPYDQPDEWKLCIY